jgi:hypothetical protein
MNAMSNEFRFDPAGWLPFRDTEVLDRVRRIKREDMEKHWNPDFKIKIIQDVSSLLVADVFTRIKMSDDEDKRVLLVFPIRDRRLFKCGRNDKHFRGDSRKRMGVL